MRLPRRPGQWHPPSMTSTNVMERKPPSETWESFTDRKIREAQEEGAFDALPGFGKPIPDLDGPDDANWWLKKKLREERLVLLPPILEARLDAEKTLAQIASMATEQQVRRALVALNERIRQAHFSPPRPPTACGPSTWKPSWPNGNAAVRISPRSELVKVKVQGRRKGAALLSFATLDLGPWTLDSKASRPDGQSTRVCRLDRRPRPSRARGVSRTRRPRRSGRREKFLAQRPEIAAELRSLIDAEEQLRKLAGAERSDKRAGDSTQSFALHGQETIAPQAGPRRSAESETAGLKQEFGRYRIVRALGKGAMGTVYLAEDTQLQRQVALKTPHFDQEPTAELLERFYREARAAATLRHPNICPVYDVGQIEGTHYISMAYIEGHPLSAFIRSGKPQPERQILIVVRKLAQALEEAHEHGIVHRDLKPANIMVDKRNEPIIMDFGLARQLQREKNIRLTQSGMLIGTPAYMSPEQIEGEPDKVGPASDQYSLGVILYELLTGQLPFRGSLTAVMAQIITKETTPPSQLRPDLDLRIEAACLKMMAKDPANRFASLAAVAEEIAAILRNPGGKQTSKAAEHTGGRRATSPDAGIGCALAFANRWRRNPSAAEAARPAWPPRMSSRSKNWPASASRGATTTR